MIAKQDGGRVLRSYLYYVPRPGIKGPGSRSGVQGPLFFDTKGPRSKVRLFEKWKKGPRSKVHNFKVGEKVQDQGPPN